VFALRIGACAPARFDPLEAASVASGASPWTVEWHCSGRTYGRPSFAGLGRVRIPGRFQAENRCTGLLIPDGSAPHDHPYSVAATPLAPINRR
jgi:hypothetical protein